MDPEAVVVTVHTTLSHVAVIVSLQDVEVRVVFEVVPSSPPPPPPPGPVPGGQQRPNEQGTQIGSGGAHRTSPSSLVVVGGGPSVVVESFSSVVVGGGAVRDVSLGPGVVVMPCTGLLEVPDVVAVPPIEDPFVPGDALVGLERSEESLFELSKVEDVLDEKVLVSGVAEDLLTEEALVVLRTVTVSDVLED